MVSIAERFYSDFLRRVLTALDEAGTAFASLHVGGSHRQYLEEVGEAIRSTPMLLKCPNLYVCESINGGSITMQAGAAWAYFGLAAQNDDRGKSPSIHIKTAFAECASSAHLSRYVF
jgi:hypothetical protein